MATLGVLGITLYINNRDPTREEEEKTTKSSHIPKAYSESTVYYHMYVIMYGRIMIIVESVQEITSRIIE